MSSKHAKAVTKAIIGLNLPSNKDTYDPEELLLDMNAAYRLSKKVLDDPNTGLLQQIRVSQFMTMLEIKAKEMGINLNEKGRIERVKRSELKKKFTITTLDVSPLDVALAQSVIVKKEN